MTGTSPHDEVSGGGLALTYGAATLERELLDATEDFTSSLERAGAGALFGKAVGHELFAAHRRAKEHLASTFSVMVVGDFKRGKSTLINALVGTAVAPVDVQPETMSINRIEYAEELTASLQSKDGGEATISPADLKRERLEPLLRRLAAPLRHLRVGAPSPLLKRVTLIDSPGLGDVFKEFEDLVRDYMAQADTIIYVLSALSPLSQSEQDYLLSGVAPRHFPKVFFVVNGVDALANDDDENRVLNLIREKVARIMPGSHVYPLSALDEWARVSGGTRPNPGRAAALEQQFAAFRAELEAAIHFRQRYYVIDRAAWAFGKTIEMAEQRTAGLQEALQRDQQQLDAAVRAIHERQEMKSKEHGEAARKLEQGFERLRREAEGWMSDFLDRFQQECVDKLATLKVPQIRQHLPFFIKDRLSKAIQACLLDHEPDIAKLFEEYATGMETEISQLVRAKTGVDRAASVPDAQWSQLQTAELVAQLLGIGQLLQIGLAVISRQSANAQSPQVAAAFQKSLPQLRDEVRTHVRNAYTNVKDSLMREWTARYEKELQGQLEDLQQATKVRESGSEQVAGVQQKLAGVREAISDKKAFLDQFKPKVWSGIEESAAGTSTA